MLRASIALHVIISVLLVFAELAVQLDEGKDLAKSVEAIKDANKRGALHFAAREGQTAVCDYLLTDLKLPVDSQDDDGASSTPISHYIYASYL